MKQRLLLILIGFIALLMTQPASAMQQLSAAIDEHVPRIIFLYGATCTGLSQIASELEEEYVARSDVNIKRYNLDNYLFPQSISNQNECTRTVAVNNNYYASEFYTPYFRSLFDDIVKSCLIEDVKNKRKKDVFIIDCCFLRNAHFHRFLELWDANGRPETCLIKLVCSKESAQRRLDTKICNGELRCPQSVTVHYSLLYKTIYSPHHHDVEINTDEFNLLESSQQIYSIIYLIEGNATKAMEKNFDTFCEQVSLLRVQDLCESQTV